MARPRTSVHRNTRTSDRRACEARKAATAKAERLNKRLKLEFMRLQTGGCTGARHPLAPAMSAGDVPVFPGEWGCAPPRLDRLFYLPAIRRTAGPPAN